MGENEQNNAMSIADWPENPAAKAVFDELEPEWIAERVESAWVWSNSYVETLTVRFRKALNRDCWYQLTRAAHDHCWILSTVRWQLAERDIEVVGADFVRCR